VLACAACPIDFDGIGQIDLGDHRDVRAIKDRGIFERLVFALCGRYQHQPQFFAQILG
jgi:hypothetical protein